MPPPEAPPCKNQKGEPINWQKLSGNEVLLNVYDLGETNAMRKVNAASAAIGGGVYHAGVEIFGVEFAYGCTEISMTGVTKCHPRCHPGHTYRSTVLMGKTQLSELKVQKILERMVDEWNGVDYHFIRKNCLDFSNALCQELGVGKIPAWVDRYGRTAEKLGNVLYSPVGAFRKSTRMLTGRAADQSPSRNIDKGFGGYIGRRGQATDLRSGVEEYKSEVDSWELSAWSNGRQGAADEVSYTLSQTALGREASSELGPRITKQAPLQRSMVSDDSNSPDQKVKQGSHAKEKAKAQVKTRAKGKPKEKGTRQAQAKAEAKPAAKPEEKKSASRARPASGNSRPVKQQAARSDPRTKLLTALFNDYDEDEDKRLKELELRGFINCLGFDGDESVWSAWYADICKELGADPQAGLERKHFKQLVKESSDMELEKLRKPALPSHPPPLPPPANPPSSDVSLEVEEVSTVQQNLSRSPDSDRGPTKATQRKELIGKLFDAFDRDADTRLNEFELRRFADRLGFEGGEDQWSEWYCSACAQVAAEIPVGFSKDQFCELIADIEVAELKNMWADLESSRSTDCSHSPQQLVTPSDEAEADPFGAEGARPDTVNCQLPAKQSPLHHAAGAAGYDLALSEEVDPKMFQLGLPMYSLVSLGAEEAPRQPTQLSVDERISLGIGIVKL